MFKIFFTIFLISIVHSHEIKCQRISSTVAFCSNINYQIDSFVNEQRTLLDDNAREQFEEMKNKIGGNNQNCFKALKEMICASRFRECRGAKNLPPCLEECNDFKRICKFETSCEEFKGPPCTLYKEGEDSLVEALHKVLLHVFFGGFVLMLFSCI